MRQYANAQQSGTVVRTPGAQPDKMQPIIDRVMMVAERLVKVEKLAAAQQETIDSQAQRIEELTDKVITLEKKPVFGNTTLKTPARTATKKPTTKATSK